jgi:hypothetical protein
VTRFGRRSPVGVKKRLFRWKPLGSHPLHPCQGHQRRSIRSGVRSRLQGASLHQCIQGVMLRLHASEKHRLRFRPGELVDSPVSPATVTVEPGARSTFGDSDTVIRFDADASGQLCATTLLSHSSATSLTGDAPPFTPTCRELGASQFTPATGDTCPEEASPPGGFVKTSESVAVTASCDKRLFESTAGSELRAGFWALECLLIVTVDDPKGNHVVCIGRKRRTHL